MKFILLILFFTMMNVSASTMAQQITLVKKSSSLRDILNILKSQVDVDFVYSNKVIEQSKLINISMHNASLKEVLDYCFLGQPLYYTMDKGVIYIRERKNKALTGDNRVDQQELREIQGTVVDARGNTISGVNIQVVESDLRRFTDKDGRFKLSVPSFRKSVVLTFPMSERNKETLLSIQT